MAWSNRDAQDFARRSLPPYGAHQQPAHSGDLGNDLELPGAHSADYWTDLSAHGTNMMNDARTHSALIF